MAADAREARRRAAPTTGRIQGVASSPLVEGRPLYYVSNRGVVWCLDIKGFRDGENDGPVTDEKLTGQNDADVIWSFDMMEEVGSYPHNLSNSSPVICGDLIFVSTSNGQDESHVNIPSPKAPAIIAINKNTGKLVWEDNSVEDRILHGQWSTPSVGTIGGVDQVVSAQGDGWVRGYEALTGKKLWEFDTNPKDSVWPKTRNEVIATPVIYRGPRLHRQRPGSRARRRRRPPLRHRRHQARRHHADRAASGTSTRSAGRSRRPSIADGLRLHPRLQRLPPLPRREDRPGVLDARHVRRRLGLAAASSTARSTSATRTATSSSCRRGKEKKVLAEMNMGSAVYATPVPAHGALFLNNRNQLFALRRCRRSDRTARRTRRSGRDARRPAGSLRCVFVLRGLSWRFRCAAQAPRRATGPSSAATPRLTGVAADGAAGDAGAEVDLRGGRGDRIVGGDRRRRRLRRRRRTAICSRSTSPRASCAGSTRPANG